MKKLFLGLSLAIAVIGCVSCSMDATDNKDSLPKVDTSKYKIAEDEYKFPAGTPALDIYTALYEANGNKDTDGKIPVTGKFEINTSAKFPDEEPSTIKTKPYNIVGLNLYRKHNEASNEFHAVIITDSIRIDWNSDKQAYVPNGILMYDYCYKWQHKNDNVWTNNKCAFEFNIKFTK